MRNALVSLINEIAKMKQLIILTLILTISQLSQAQKPKLIKSKKDFFHYSSGLNFPLKIDEYARVDIYSFDKKKNDIGVTYKNSITNGETTFTIYVYQAGDGTEDRLRHEYLNSMQSIANFSANGINATQHAVSHKKSGYKINGFKAEINENKSKSSLSVFECGGWFFKIRISSETQDIEMLNKLESDLLKFFEPTNLVRKKHLDPKASIYFSKTAFVDSLMLGCSMASAYGKLGWAMENIDSLERASGFPGIYLDLHITALREMVKFEQEHLNFSKTERTEKYLNELKSIIDNGFVEEFVMDQYNMVLKVPDNLIDDFESYQNWKLDNPISINLHEKFYVISFDK